MTLSRNRRRPEPSKNNVYPVRHETCSVVAERLSIFRQIDGPVRSCFTIRNSPCDLRNTLNTTEESSGAKFNFT